MLMTVVVCLLFSIEVFASLPEESTLTTSIDINKVERDVLLDTGALYKSISATYPKRFRYLDRYLGEKLKELKQKTGRRFRTFVEVGVGHSVRTHSAPTVQEWYWRLLRLRMQGVLAKGFYFAGIDKDPQNAAFAFGDANEIYKPKLFNPTVYGGSFSKLNEIFSEEGPIDLIRALNVLIYYPTEVQAHYRSVVERVLSDDGMFVEAPTGGLSIIYKKISRESWLLNKWFSFSLL